MHDPEKILKQYWGYDSFRTLQKEIISSILSQHDTIALLPTGGGKSLCYQLPAMCMEGLCLVISPLIALMKDQVDQLNKQGIKAYAIYTGLTNREIDIILDNCIYGDIKLLYVSPERLQTEIFRERVKNMNVNLLAVDEAHCISQWGYDFRPTYLQIAEFRDHFIEGVNTIALTATATGQVVDDICEKLMLQEPRRFKASFERENLALAVRKPQHKESKLLEILERVSGSALIYVRNRRKTKEITTWLLQNRISADYYHAGLGHDLRTKKQELWQSGQTRVMVATNAFGMGINKNNVRIVIHYDIPDSLEAYYQEAGRAGRDGKKAYAVVLYHEGDKHQLYQSFENSNPSPEFIGRVYQALANYYKIAVGSNMLSYFDFDITDFCNRFNFSAREAYYAIQKLEEEGFIELNESFYHPSKVTFNIDKTELYKYQIANVSLEPVIKTLLRLYGGELFGNFMRISENQIARVLNMTLKKVRQQLEALNEQKIITYDKMRDKPQLAFITQRYDASALPLDIERLKERRKIRKQKLDAIIRYVEDMEHCRTRIILGYFGEKSFDDCGHCDYCIDKKRILSKSDHNRIREMIHYHLNKGPIMPDELSRVFAHHEQPLLDEIIREMSERDQIAYDLQGRLHWKQ